MRISIQPDKVLVNKLYKSNCRNLSERVTVRFECFIDRESANTRDKIMSEHKHGEMNTFSQQKMFEKFVKFTTRSIIFAIGVLIFMALVGA